jgi:hypothetical protein
MRKRESGHGKRRCQIVKDVRAAPFAMNHYKDGPLVAPSQIADIYAIDAGILGLMRRGVRYSKGIPAVASAVAHRNSQGELISTTLAQQCDCIVDPTPCGNKISTATR